MTNTPRMKQPLTMAVMGCLLLGACAPLNTYYKPGASVTATERQTLACEVDALAKAPRALRTVRGPSRFVPARQICDNSGKCRSFPAYFEPGPVYTVDANQELRDRVERQCMADAGFAPVSIPACPSSVAQAAPTAATTTLPPLTPKSCAIRNSDGSFQIVTRG